MDLTQDEVKLWEELRRLARNNDKICYEDAMAFVHMNVQDPEDRYIYFSKMLDNINRYENENNRPMLTAVVIHKKVPGQSAMPGQGFFVVAEMLKKKKASEDDYDFWAKELKRVHEYWPYH